MKNIHSYLHTTDFVVVAAYLLVLIAIGYWVSFIKKKQSNENFFLAGNSLGWGSIGFTMWGTNVGPSMLVASASAGFTSGIVTGNFGWYAFIFIFLLATVFAPRYLGAKVRTLPEFMGQRFGDSTRNILAWYTMIVILITWLSLTLFAGGELVHQMLGLAMWKSVILLVAISSFFTLAGGLKAIAYTNVFQMLLLILVSLSLTIVGLKEVGGIAALYEKTPAEYWNLFLPLDNKDYPWIAIILGYPVMGVWFWCTDQSMVQSVLGAKNLKQGQLGANFTGWLKIFDVALFIIPGITCFALFPSLNEPKEAYMTMVTRLLPVGMVGLVMAVLIAALISTIDSALNSLSTVFTTDIVLKRKPGISQKEVVRTGRIVTIVGAFIAIFLSLAFNNIKHLNFFDVFQSVLGLIAPPMSVVFLFGVLWKKTTKLAANVALIVGTAISLSTGFLFYGPFKNHEFWPHYLLISFYLFLFIAAMTYLVTIFDKKGQANTENSLDFKVVPKPGKKVMFFWIALIIVMVGFYILFNGHA